MKKWIAGLLLFVLAVWIGLTIFLPGQYTVSDSAGIKANASGILRALSNQETWKQWWPRSSANVRSGSSANKKSFVYNSHGYTLLSITSNAVDIGIRHHDDTFVTTLLVAPVGFDSTLLDWRYELKANSWNVFQKIKQYRRQAALKENVHAIFQQLQTYLEKPENVYGIRVQLNKVTDTTLITTRSFFDREPNTDAVYTMIHQLQSYCTKEGATQTGFPMLNVRREDSNRYEAMVAIPVNAPLPTQGNIAFKRMFAGNILVTEVTGGPQRIKEAFEQLQLYMQDYQYQPPVIPFESLITDRSKETDTAKWVTKIYFPVL